MTTPEDPRIDQHMSRVTSLATAVIRGLGQETDHQLVMDALISAYASVATLHTCCTQRAARIARDMASLIDAHAAKDAANLH